MTYLPSDRIRVFVSSRLGECEAERSAARDVIRSLGHEPVMFEAAGARPHAPRSVYLRGLEESQILVGIYREGYGYIAGDMEISGLEDEYRFARSLGIPQLLYVVRDGAMESRLKALVDEFKTSEITVAYFEDAAELADKIGSDLVALVSDYFRRGTSYTQSIPTDPRVLADALVPPTGRLQRKNMELELESQLEVHLAVLVTGPLGSGKTVFVSALSSEQGWAFVECGENTPHEVLTDAANAIRCSLDLPAKAFVGSSDAASALQVAWETSQFVTLVLDDVRDQETVDRIRSVAPVSPSHRLIFSSRKDIPTVASVYRIPPLTIDETRMFIELNRNEHLVSGELVELHNASKGSPLYLRYYLSGESGNYATSLADYETRVWASLTAGAREILCYLAWSNRPLSLEDLAQLFSGSSRSTEELAETIGSASSLLAQSDHGYSIFHPHAKSTIQNLTRRSKPRLTFYIERLRKWYSDNHDYVSAFSTLTAAGFSTPPNLLEMAGRQAIVKGDFRIALEILDAQINLARISSDKTRERNLTLYLAHVMGLSGRSERALELIDCAAALAVDTEPPFDFSQLRATIGALGRGEKKAFEELLKIREDYRKEGKLWDAGRLSVDLSVYYVRQNESEKAAAEAEFAMGVFRDHRDDYGFKIARGNYLSAISALPGKEIERDKLINELDAETAEQPRQRALLCNVLARRARTKGDTLSAKDFAREAIEIGKDIGDHAIVCNNLMNLGNSYRDEEKWELAIAQYEAADKIAGRSKLVLIEASAQELLASAFNRSGDGERAVHHANYAISISRGVSDRIESNATEELARAYELNNRENEARKTWLKYAALEIERANDVESGSYGFYRAALLMKGRMEQYVIAYGNLYVENALDSGDLSLGERLIGDLPNLFQKIGLAWTFEVAVLHARLLFGDVPDMMARRVYLVAMQGIFGAKGLENDVLKRLRIALALSMAVPKGILELSDIVDVGEIISRTHENISFRASPDGAAHWTIEISLGGPVLVSVIQMDDRPDVSLITLCLVLVLVAFAPNIFDDVLSGISPKRAAANVHVSNFGEAKELLHLSKIGLDGEPDGCEVTRATDVAVDEGVPILVITSETLTSEWLGESGSAHCGRVLFARVIVELVFHLQSGEVEAESLYPKVAHMISKTIV